jgi:hypothetical protein
VRWLDEITINKNGNAISRSAVLGKNISARTLEYSPEHYFYSEYPISWKKLNFFCYNESGLLFSQCIVDTPTYKRVRIWFDKKLRPGNVTSYTFELTYPNAFKNLCEGKRDWFVFEVNHLIAELRLKILLPKNLKVKSVKCIEINGKKDITQELQISKENRRLCITLVKFYPKIGSKYKFYFTPF